MNTYKNRVQLIGRLGNDPIVKVQKNGKQYAVFRMATKDFYYNYKGEKTEDTQWHKIVAHGNMAEITGKYLKKGCEVALEGKLVYHSYRKGIREKRYLAEIKMTEILTLSNGKCVRAEAV